jgi:branched-chain amino acid transport system ATP-binding protein
MTDVLGAVLPEPGVAKPDPVLVVDNVCRTFGGLLAVDVDHLEVQRHTVTALIGPNGAGKTTLFNLLTGFDKPTRGTWSFDSDEIAGWPAYRIARRGMVRTFQLTKALARLSVMENMLLGAPHQRGERFALALWPPSWSAQEKANRARALELLENFGLLAKRDDLAGTLSGGQRKLLEMARALMVDPSLVMLDEPMAGVNPVLVQSLLDHVLALRDEGRTVVFVEHDMDVVMNISDWVVCMAEGRVIAEGPPSTIVRNPAVIDAYLGREHGEKPPGAAAPAAGPSAPEREGLEP